MEFNFSDRSIDVNVSPFFQPFIGSNKFAIHLNEHTYRPQENLLNDWLSFAYRAFQSLHYLLDEEGIKPSSFIGTSLYSCPLIIQEHLLTLHFQCLIQARQHLTQNGSVINSIGGRVPRSVFNEMFRQAGYRAKVLVLGLKPQTEVDEVLPGYVNAENSLGINFNFYRLDNFTSDLPYIAYTDNPNLDEETFLADIEPYRVGTVEALKLYQEGIPIGHTVYMFRAQLADRL